MEKNEKWGLTNEQVDFIVKNHKRYSLKKIADKLGIDPNKVYYFSRKVKLRKKRVWTPKEEEYLIDQIGIKTVRMIARELQRTELAIYSKCFEMGISIAEDDSISEGVKIKPLCAKTGIPMQTAYTDVRSGKLKSHGRAMYGRKHYILDLEDINSWVAWRFPLKEFSCYECGEACTASILCKKHLPKEFKKTFTGKIKHFIKFGESEPVDLTDKLINTIKEIRELENVTQKEISEKACFSTRWYATIENRHKNVISVDDIERVINALGYDLEITLTRRKKQVL